MGDAAGLCTRYCTSDADCPDGLDCIVFRGFGADAVALCVDIDLCIDEDGDGYGFGPGCDGPDCDDSDPRVYPGATERCDGRDTNCNGRIDHEPVFGEVDGVEVRIGDPCDTGSPGVCSEGRWRCVSGSTVCEAVREPEATERCDTLDRTCDGSVDRDADGALLERTCYSGADGTEGIGRCRGGTQRCDGGDWTTVCEGEVLPREERCNGEDDSCDGVVDNVDPSLLTADRRNCGACGNACADHLDCRDGACACAPGLSECGERCVDLQTSNQHCGACDVVCGARFACIDGGCVRTSCEPGTTRPCESACGEGIETCTDDGWVGCTAPAAGVTRDCEGPCDSGRQTCGETGWSPCSATALGSTEPCATPCGSGVLTCTEEGWSGCSAPGIGDTRRCESTCGEGEETCTEEGWRNCSAPLLNASRGCTTICEDGTEFCTPDGWAGCTAREPAPERCNLFDDLCDGTLDTGLSCRRPVHRLLRATSGNWAFTDDADESIPGFVLHAEQVFWLYDSDAEGRAIPFYRCFNPEIRESGRHFLTADSACERWQPEHLERPIGYISPFPLDNTVPLYRSFEPVVSTHFYTTNFVEHRVRVEDFGALDEGIVGHVWTGP